MISPLSIRLRLTSTVCIMEEYFNLNLTLATASYIVNTLNFTDFTTESFNSLNFTQNQMEQNQTAASRSVYLEEETTRMIQVIVRPILIVCGTIGNLISFYVMRRGSLKEVSTCFYMSILALVDTGNVLREKKKVWKEEDNVVI